MQRKTLFLLLGFFGFLLFLEPSGSWLFDPDETRYALIPHEMLARMDFITPYLNGTAYLQKPPLLYWLNSFFMKLFGESPYAVRLTTRFSCLGIALLLFFFLRRHAGLKAGLWAAVIALSAIVPVALGRTNVPDAPLSLGLTFTLLSMWSLLREWDAGRSARGMEVCLGLGLAFSFLAKGLIGVVFPGLIFFAYIAAMGQWDRIKKIVLSPVLPIFIAVASPWFILTELKHPGFSDYFFIQEHFVRYTTKHHNRPGPPYYFVFTFLLGFLPWTGFFLRSVRPVLTIKVAQWRSYPDHLYFVLWVGAIIGFFSLSSSKLITYALPAFPGAAALTALWLDTPTGNRKKIWAYQLACFAGLVPVALLAGWKSATLARMNLFPEAALIGAFMLAGALLAFALSDSPKGFDILASTLSWAGIIIVLIFCVPKLSHDYSDYHLFQAANRIKADQIVCFKSFSYSVPWYSKQTIPVVGFQGELASDNVFSPEIFWNEEQFWEAWHSDKRLLVYCAKDQEAKLHQSATRKPYVVARNHRGFFAINFPPIIKVEESVYERGNR